MFTIQTIKNCLNANSVDKESLQGYAANSSMLRLLMIGQVIYATETKELHPP